MLQYTTLRCTPALVARFYSPPTARTVQRAQRLWVHRCHRIGRKDIHTLDPVRLQPSDYIHMGGQKYKVLLPQPRLSIEYLRGYTGRTRSSDREQSVFPPDTHGFLYYHPPTSLLPLDEGHLRFRITPSADRATFSQGKDLLYPDNEPWHIRGGRIAITKEYLHFRRMLLEDGLVTEAQLIEWGSRYSPRGKRLRDVIDDLEKPFFIDFEGAHHRFYIRSPSGEHKEWTLIHPLTVRQGANATSLCTGRAICRFEDAGVRTGTRSKYLELSLRLVKVLKPLRTSEEALNWKIPPYLPEEGELFRQYLGDHPWTKRIGRKTRALYAVWERWASERGEGPARVKGGR
ncbi:hypothetical protein OF83DRAFT_1140378 [Amylostereum chailletii]|nr:hypothetical protein OF83DRAFT_1140378 [Amylostereum chailletii]